MDTHNFNDNNNNTDKQYQNTEAPETTDTQERGWKEGKQRIGSGTIIDPD